MASRLDLRDALAALNVPSVSVALIDGGMLAWPHAWGAASVQTLFQAASLSKTVTAVAALRLVNLGRLKLDRNVNEDFVAWRIPENALTAGHPLRALLSMTAGISVPGYVGYDPGASLPTLEQILDGVTPANSPPVRVENVPGTRYAYSGGGYEIVQAIREETGDVVSLGEGVVYPVLHALERSGAITSQRRTFGGRSRIYYSLSPKGASRLTELTELWTRLTGAVKQVLVGGGRAGLV